MPDQRLLDDLVRQAAATLAAVRLNAELQQSRERLVNAREEERRRIRRDLHDGLGPTLAALGLKLETARNRLADDPRADVLLAELAERTQGAVGDIRRLVYALRPPALDDLGLVGALRQLASSLEGQQLHGLKVSVEAVELPTLPAAVEVAVYRIVQEALTNVAKHAHAAHARVLLSPEMVRCRYPWRTMAAACPPNTAPGWAWPRCASAPRSWAARVSCRAAPRVAPVRWRPCRSEKSR